MNKKELICKYDNKNQSLIMKNEISMKDYIKNKDIIHELYDNMDKYTIHIIRYGLKSTNIKM